MNEWDDILRAQRGDREAFGRLVERYRNLVFGICYGMTTQRADAEDLAHDAFVEAFLKLRTLRDPGRFAAWLHTLTLNVCRMWHRQRKRECLDFFEAPKVDALAAGSAPLAGYFSRLSDSHRMALALHYWEGLSYAEMARFLTVPIGTVMSRLSRARRALKAVMAEDGDAVMDDDGRDLYAEVDAEIEVLLKLFGNDGDARDRLRMVLEKSPDRFRQVIAQVEDGASADQVAMLVRHLGPPAVDATVGCYFDGDADAKAKACAVLQRVMNTWLDRDPEKRHVMPLVPGVYLILDAVMRAPERGAQIELLIALLEASEFDSVNMVLACVLRGYGDAAFGALMDCFHDLENPGERRKTEGFLEALRLFGTRFFTELLPLLRSSHLSEIRLGLHGAGVVAGLLDASRSESRLETEWMVARRTQGMLFVDRMDERVLDDLTRAVAHLAAHADRAVRIWAIDILKYLPPGIHLSTLRDCLRHEDPDMRLAAMRTLAELGDRGCVRILIDSARESEGLVLRKTLEALGHLRAQEAQPLMEALLDHADRSVREAAILALGNAGNERAREKLKRLTGSPDKKIARVAASALYGGKRSRGKMSALTRARLQKIRGDAQPSPWLYRSVVAAIRCLPEIRPYEETALTHRIACLCADYATTRRMLVSGRNRLMTREKGIYRFEPLGEAVWRVERFIQERFLNLEYSGGS